MENDQKTFRCELKIRLLDGAGEPFMGVGLVWLLERIEALKSISKAAADMKLSYPKALRMLGDLEGALGHQVVLRHKGGSERGGAELTDEGRRLVAQFRAFCEEVQGDAQRRFEQQYRQRMFAGEEP